MDMEDYDNGEALLAELAQLLGPRAIAPEGELPEYLACTSGARRKIVGIVFPRSRDEVVAVVQQACAARVPLYPLSTGHNWGYGSANPVMDGAVVLDLSRMDRIEDFDVESGLITLEPGVTQAKLARYLSDQRGAYRYMVPTTGAGPSGSILGNALERGFGITPLSDHFAALTSLEAVLADGSLYRSPLSALGGPGVDHAFKWGIGPYVDGLFSQGAFGVVTRATFALARRPERVEAVVFRLADDAMLEGAVEAVRELLFGLPSGLIGGVNLMNARRVLAMTAPYPRAALNAEGLIPQTVLDEMCRRHAVAPWTGFATLYGSQRLVAAARKEIRRRLRPAVSRLAFVSPGLVERVRKAAGWLGPLRHRAGRIVNVLQSSLELVQGVPNETALPLAYWRNRKHPAPGEPLDPARDGCGLIWYAPLVEMKAPRVREYVDFVTNLMLAQGMESLITLTSLSERCFSSTVPVLFDAQDPAQATRARTCHRALLEAGREHGFLPYRVGIDSMAWLVDAAPDHFDLVGRLKAVVDPFDILSRGRYAPPAPRAEQS